MKKSGEALYLFCFARPDLLGEIEGVGVDGQHPLFVFRPFPDLCAIVSEVPLEDFCGPAAELQMQQLAWVGPRACRHEAVVEQVMGHSPVLPARFGTLFSSQESLAEFLASHRQTISQFLERMAHQEEWSVKGLLDREQAARGLASASLAAHQEKLVTLPPGTRYFQERRIRSVAEKELSLWLKDTCRQVASDLRKQASDFCDCPVVLREAADSGTEVVLNWAFLLPKNAIAAFRSQIDQVNENHASRGLVFELSGPWPSYRFVPPISMGTAP